MKSAGLHFTEILVKMLVRASSVRLQSHNKFRCEINIGNSGCIWPDTIKQRTPSLLISCQDGMLPVITFQSDSSAWPAVKLPFNINTLPEKKILLCQKYLGYPHPTKINVFTTTSLSKQTKLHLSCHY